MRLEKASKEAMKYACKHFHYSKSIPDCPFGYSVFENDKWCGCVLYGRGANNNLAKEFGLKQGEVIELVRMALNGKQSCTSKVLALSLKLVKKDCPLAKIIVSYADTEQGHTGIIYQATNWIYLGASICNTGYAIDPRDGKVKHTRILNSKYGSIKGFKYVSKPPKHKYMYCIDKSLKDKYTKKKKTYPKSCDHGVKVTQSPQGKDGVSKAT